jgi:hypothetical protein
MEVKKLLQFSLVFGILAGFTLVSVGALASQGGLVQAVSATRESAGGEGMVVSVRTPAFESKLLGFLRREEVCSLSAGQALAIGALYETETETVEVDGETVSVLYVNGSPLNKNLLERAIGEPIGDGRCHVVHANKAVALLTPVIVS